MSKNKIILHYDMDAFYASIEIRDRPNLKDKPVIVGTSVITTCNYIARKYGLHSAMSVTKARILCPHGIFLKVDMNKYSQVSKKIKSLVLRLTNKVEFIASDEGYVDISDLVENYSSLEEFAKRFQKGIYRNTKLTCSIGIGYNKLSAKIASDAKKPGGITILKNEEEFVEYMRDKNLKLIPGIGKKAQELLAKQNIITISDVLKKSLQELRSVLGYNRGEMLYEYARGIDNRKLSRSSKNHSIGSEGTYSSPIDDKDFIWSEFIKMLRGVHQRLNKQNYYTKTLTLKIRYLDRRIITKSKSLTTYTNDYKKLLETMKTLFEDINFDQSVKLLGVSLSSLSKNRVQQLSFKKVSDIEKERKILELKEEINKFKN